MKRDEYKRIMDGIRPDPTLKKELEDRIMNKRYIKPGVKAAVVAAACLGIAALLVFGIPLLKGGADSGQSVLRLFVTTAYAEGADQPSEPADVELKPDVKTVIGSYSPAMSSVPGFPFYAQCESADKIVVETDSGNILLWSNTDYTISNQGKRYEAKPSERVYWGPMDESGNAAAAQHVMLTFTAYKGEKKLGEQRISLQLGKDFLYTAEFLK
jgi:hypothetical protein